MRHTRKTFLKTAAASVASSCFLPGVLSAQAIGANERVRIGLIGCGIRGKKLCNLFKKEGEAQVVAICDPDTAQMDRLAGQQFKSSPASVDQVQDYRKLLERNDIDAVLIASPNHWHVLQAIQSVQAGKHVYVEKPVSHDPWEGLQLLAASQKYNKVIAAGHQNRSDPGPRDGIAYVRSGALGKIEHVHICCVKNRSGIGKTDQPLPAPDTCNYDLWLGPAQDLPMHREQFHYDWHWIWNTGNGDIGNQGPHEIDLANWTLGDPDAPETIQAYGGRFGWDDAGETPNLIVAHYRQAGIPVTIEVNDLALSPEKRVAANRNGVRTGIIIQCEEGFVKGGRGGMYATGLDGGKPVQKFPGDGGKSHSTNFITAVKSNSDAHCASTVSTALKAALISQMANLSFRTGDARNLTEVKKEVAGNEVLERVLSDQAAQLNNWNLDEPVFQWGTTVKQSGNGKQLTGGDFNPAWLRKSGRGNFEVPEIA